MENTYIGKFITLEGIEGVGKSSNLNFIAETLSSLGITVVKTREPGGTPIAEKIRQILLEKHSEVMCDETELLLMFAARKQHLHTVIEPALAAGQWVVCDRFTDATYAYQGGGRGIAEEVIAYLEQLVQKERRPDLTLLLDAPVSIGLQRARSTGPEDRFEQETIAFFESIRETYLTRAYAFPDRYHCINSEQTLAEVQAQIKDILLDFVEK